MKMRITKNRIIVIAVMASSMISNYCFAGAWTLPEGKLYDKASVNKYTTDPDFTDMNLGNYIEYGLTDDVSLVNSIYYKKIRILTRSPAPPLPQQPPASRILK